MKYYENKKKKIRYKFLRKKKNKNKIEWKNKRWS